MLVLLVVAMTLSSCWSGPPLFDSRDAVAAIADGTYVVREPARPGQPERMPEPGEDAMIVRRQPDNSLHVTMADDVEQAVDYRILAVPLADAEAGRFVLQVQQRRDAAPDDVGYLLLDTRPSPVRLAILPCSSAVRVAVEASGGHVARDPNSASQCIFRDRATLLAQLRRFTSPKASPNEELELIEISARR